MSIAPDNTAYRLSPAQEGMLFHSLLTPGEAVYFEQRWCTLRGPLDIADFRSAWQQVMARHDVLRTAFHWQGGKAPLQEVLPLVELPLQEQDWRTLSTDDQNILLKEFLESDRHLEFDLSTAPLMRCALMRIDDVTWRFVWSYHHLLMDGWCNGILIAEVLAFYRSLRQNKPVSWLPVTPYRHFIEWLQRQDQNAAEIYWRGALAGIDETTALPDRSGIRDGDGDGQAGFAEQISVLPSGLFHALQQFARTSHLTLNTIIQGAWGLWLARYNGNQDAVFGAVVANRPAQLPGVERMIGLFINTVPVRVRTPDDVSVQEWLQQLQQQQRTRDEFGHCGLSDIHRWAGVPAGQSLFSSILVFENYPLSSAMALAHQAGDELTISEGDGYERTHYPLALMVIPSKDNLQICVRHDRQQFGDGMVHDMLSQLQTLSQRIVEHPSAPLGQIHAVTTTELKWQEEHLYGAATTIPALGVTDQFAQQVLQRPNQIALMFADGESDAVQLTYQELNVKVSELANQLSQQGVGPGSRVGLCLSRSLSLPIAMLAVWRVGAAYVPLDPGFPLQRIDYVSNHVRVGLLVCDASTVSIVDSLECAAPRFNLDQRALLDSQSATDFASRAYRSEPDELAYIIYTSGSTGRPKGVAITHRSLNNFLASMAHTPGICQDDRLLAVTTVSFDISVLELFLPLVNGACLVLAEASVSRDAQRLARCIDQYDIRILQASPATWRLLQASDWAGKTDLRMLCGGEALDLPLANWLLEHGGELWNLYGPTETTVWSAALRITSEELIKGHVPVGGPIANTGLRVLDKQLRPVPVGTPGVLYVSGAGLAQGYFDQPDLTAQVFLPNPFPTGGERLYCTGDRVCLNQDSTITFLGRADYQIKLRGYRIEAGEIEATIQRHSIVRQAVVMAQPGSRGDPVLTAWLVPENFPPQSGMEDSLCQWLRDQLPAYMVPAQWIWLDKMPLTPNGKIDRKALPILDNQPLDTSSSPRQPLDSVQERVAMVWSDILKPARDLHLQDDFFTLGGHSLLATQAIGQLQERHGWQLPLRMLFDYPVLGDFCEQVRRFERPAIIRDDISVIRRDGLLPLSWPQRRQWLLQRFNPQGDAYHIPVALQLKGTLDHAALATSFQQLVNRHESLRQVFVEQNGEPWAKLLSSARSQALRLIDCTQHNNQARETAITDAICHQQSQPFDLAKGPLYRLELLRFAADDHVLLLNVHHIAVDDVSLGILVQELGQLYQQNLEDKSVPYMGASMLDYADFAAWQRQQEYSRELDYWKSQLNDLPDPLSLPQSVRATSIHKAGRIQITLDSTLVSQLRAIGRQQGATLYVVLLTGFYLLLSRYSGSRDLLVASPVANRSRPELHNVVGLFVNTLLLRTKLDHSNTFHSLLAQVRKQVLDAFDHQDLPFEQLIDALPALRTQSGEPAQVMFALQAAELERFALADLEWSSLPIQPTLAKFDLNLSLRQFHDDQGATQVKGHLEYRADMFDAALMERFVRHYQRILNLMVDPPSARFDQWTLLDKIELDSIVALCRGPQVQTSLSAHALFAQRAECYPHAIAVIDGHRQISYGELNYRANQLAHLLLELGVTAETPVGLWAERGWPSLVSMLAILKAGACFVPLDPQQPDARLIAILRASRVGLVLSASGGQLPASVSLALPDCVELPLDVLEPELAIQSKQNPSGEVSPDQLAYIMYTSGSTGEPKGVATPHRGIVRLVCDPRYVTLNSDTVTLQAAPLAFDAATFEIWGSLLNGGRIVILPGAHTALDKIAQLIRRHRINTAWFTAGLLNALVDEQLDALSRLQQVLAGGDVLSLPHIRRLQAAAADLRIINGYGPTETTTFSCCHTLTPTDLQSHKVPIGRPITNTQLFILDRFGQPVPAGVTGELFVAGDGLARGYLNRPDLTAEAFVPNPFYRPSQFGETEQILYRTGDQVCLRDDGTLEFFGRIDQQIKIRGFRIETQEISNTLQQHPNITRAHVDAVEQSGRKQLVAWISGDNIDMPQAHHWLVQQLPDYMVPAIWVPVDTWPITANGKLDRRALPPIAQASPIAESSLLADDLEQTLLDLWLTLLPADHIQPDSNFFALGGDSIIAMQLASRAIQLGLPLTPALMFQNPTVRQLAKQLRQAIATGTVQWEAAPQWPTGLVPLTPIQHWFFQQAFVHPEHFNQAVMLRLNQPVDQHSLQQICNVVVARHDGFRLRFRQNEAGWHQWLDEQKTHMPLSWIDLRALATDKQMQQLGEYAGRAHSSLDLHHGPLGNMTVFHCHDGLRLLVVIHHLIIDGVSWRLLLADLHRAWQQHLQGRPIALGPKPLSFQQHAQRLQTAILSGDTIAYWQQFNATDNTSLPLDLEGGENIVGNSASIAVSLDAETSGQLLKAAVDNGETPMAPDRLLAALACSLGHWSDQSRLLIHLESHGREMLSEEQGRDFSQTLGWFTSLYPFSVATPVNGESITLMDSAQQIAEQRRTVPHGGLSWGVLRHLQPDTVPSVVPTIVFNYLGQLDAGLAVGGDFIRESAPGDAVHANNPRAHLLDINAWIENGCLNVEWIYSTHHHLSSTIKMLADNMIERLRASLLATGSSTTPASSQWADIDADALAAALDQVSFEADL